jgi:hypothetical protein
MLGDLEGASEIGMDRCRSEAKVERRQLDVAPLERHLTRNPASLNPFCGLSKLAEFGNQPPCSASHVGDRLHVRKERIDCPRDDRCVSLSEFVERLEHAASIEEKANVIAAAYPLAGLPKKLAHRRILPI